MKGGLLSTTNLSFFLDQFKTSVHRPARRGWTYLNTRELQEQAQPLVGPEMLEVPGPREPYPKAGDRIK